MANWSDIALVAGIGAGLYFLWGMGKDLFSSLGVGSVSEAVSSVNPFEQVPNLVGSLSDYFAALSAYNAKVAATEAAIAARKETQAEIAAASTPEAELEAYRESYSQEVAHSASTWVPITVEGRTYETAEEWLQETLKSKGKSDEEIAYITGSTSTLPSSSSTLPTEKMKTISLSSGAVQETVSGLGVENTIAGITEALSNVSSKGKSSSSSSSDEDLVNKLREEAASTGQALGTVIANSDEYARMRGWI